MFGAGAKFAPVERRHRSRVAAAGRASKSTSARARVDNASLKTPRLEDLEVHADDDELGVRRRRAWRRSRRAGAASGAGAGTFELRGWSRDRRRLSASSPSSSEASSRSCRLVSRVGIADAAPGAYRPPRRGARDARASSSATSSSCSSGFAPTVGTARPQTEARRPRRTRLRANCEAAFRGIGVVVDEPRASRSRRRSAGPGRRSRCRRALRRRARDDVRPHLRGSRIGARRRRPTRILRASTGTPPTPLEKVHLRVGTTRAPPRPRASAVIRASSRKFHRLPFARLGAEGDERSGRSTTSQSWSWNATRSRCAKHTRTELKRSPSGGVGASRRERVASRAPEDRKEPPPRALRMPALMARANFDVRAPRDANLAITFSGPPLRRFGEWEMVQGPEGQVLLGLDLVRHVDGASA